MTLKDVRDTLSRMFVEDRSLESKEINHILIEDVDGINHFDYMLRDDNEDDSDIEEDDDYEYDDESDDYEYEDDDSELEDESWESGDDSDLEESY